MTEDYCDFETAKLLKEKGFDYYPDGSYWLIDANNVMYWVSEIGAYDYVDNPTDCFQRPKNGYRLVTLWMAMKWLREVHGIHIVTAFLGPSLKWTPTIWKIDMVIPESKHVKSTINTWETYEESCEAAIKYCLENLI